MKERFKPVIDYYKDLRWHNLNSEKYRHLWLLLYWPIYGFFFLFVERLLPLITPAITYYPVACAWDDAIPFCEFFVLPYYYWFAFLVGMGLYGLMFEIRAFRNFSWFVILSYSFTIVIYILWPTKQELRPTEFARDNICTAILNALYNFDTDTNVCPSIHVLGSVAVCCAGIHSEKLRGFGWKAFFIVSTILISVSTVFLKQHSIIDVIAALAVCAICWPLTVWAVPALEKKYFDARAKKRAGKTAAETPVELVPNTETPAEQPAREDE